MTIKPNIFRTFTAKFARIPRIVGLVSGTGLGINDGTWFQNRDDLGAFVEKCLIWKGNGIVIRSGGYSLENESPAFIKALRHELWCMSSCALISKDGCADDGRWGKK